ncbi:MAG: protein kinase [Dehalococcoidia bacterium]
MRERFVREGQALARVRHPNVVQVFDAGEAGGQVYLAMEYVPGRSLADIAAGRPLPLGAVAPVVQQLGAALDAIHAAGLVHRDIASRPTCWPGCAVQCCSTLYGLPACGVRSHQRGMIVGTLDTWLEQAEPGPSGRRRTSISWRSWPTPCSPAACRLTATRPGCWWRLRRARRPTRASCGADPPAQAAAAIQRGMAKEPARFAAAGQFAAALAGPPSGAFRSRPPARVAPPVAESAPLPPRQARCRPSPHHRPPAVRRLGSAVGCSTGACWSASAFSCCW